MAELVLSAVLPVLFDKLTSRELLEFATQEGVRSKLKKWEKTLKMINALLIDAEEKQLTNGAVKMWLEDLQDLAYDAEDILDEYATEALSRKLKIEEHQASTSRARKLIPACCIGCTPHALWSDFSMRSKIDDITSRLQNLCNQKTELGLIEIEIAGRRLTGLQRPPTTSSQIETVVYGRDDDKAKILEMVLSDAPGDANYGVVSIVGMGGLGKTTLAQHVYNDKEMADFDPKGWVCISDDFDVTKISKAILESITKSGTNLTTLDAVQNRLKEKLAGRKFLLVLDDVWNEDYSKWQILRSPFTVGARGSKIIVTTRHERVALTMGHSNRCHRLLGLSDDDCWSLFKKHAIDDEVLSSHPVELIRQKVVEKCKGLPLAATTLGGLLRSKEIDEWLDILNSKTWELLNESEIPTALQISYHHLPSHLKRCFAYCGILPKDYQFEENELILLWVAEGLIQQTNDNKQLKELGGEYFRDLLSRSIFQISSHNNSKFIMHDLVNDLAQMVSGNLSFRLEGELESNQLRTSKKTRYASHLSLLYNLNKRFEVFNDFVCLRTYLSMPQINDEGYARYYISNRIISDLFWWFKRLRVLSLQNYYIIELPDSIGDLRLLRHLNLSNTDIKCLPESVKSMYNLQTLILRNCCKFLKWPSNMRNLINLRHLDILGAYLVEEMPMGIRKWTCLQMLSNFIVGKDSGSKLEDLEVLKSLCGELHISRLENVTNFQHKRNILLTNKKDLKVLLLEWGSRFNASSDEERDKRLLDMLQPHQNLEKLTIKCYGGKTFSSWVGDSSFSKMTVLKLEDCKSCTSLPSLGLLGSLKSLTIKGIKELESINPTFYGHSQNPFISLETLCFENLEKCESWDPIKENESFPWLQEFSIVNCPKFSGRLPNKLSSLKKLVIRECEQLVVSLANMPKLCELELNKCKKIMCTSSTCLESLECMTLSNISDFDDLSRQELKKVQNLRIVGCKELIKLWKNEIFTLTTLLEGTKQKSVRLEELRIESCDSLNFIFRGQLPQSLKKLHIEECEKLQCLLGDNEDTSTSTSSATFSLPSKEVNASTSHLEDLYIRGCSSLTCLPSIDQLSATLTSLHVSNCPKLTTLSMTGHLPVALKRLSIEFCSELTTLLPKGQFPETLEILRIWKCEKLESIVEKFPETLENLSIHYCEKLESIVEKFHNNQALYEIRISCCKNLKSLPEGLETLTNLKSLVIEKCRGLASFPKGGFPDSNLRVHLYECEMLEALPCGIHTLSSLEIYRCQNMSLSEKDLLTKLTRLEISSPKQYKLLTERGFHNFTSLSYLSIHGGQDGESFQETDMEITLPLNITGLDIQGFQELKCLSFKDFEHLSSLEILSFNRCPKLTSLPNILPSSLLHLHILGCLELTSLPSVLPSSLEGLVIRGCPSLKEACKRDKGKEWSKIIDIPCILIDPEPPFTVTYS